MRRDVSNILKQWKDEAKIDGIILISGYPSFGDTFKICTAHPGPMIGKGGELYNKYKEKFQQINPHLKSIEFVETDNWYIK